MNSVFQKNWGGRHLLAAILLWACSSALPAHSQAPDAHTMAQRVDQHYNKLHSLKAWFTESYDGLGVKRSESGTLLMEKPGRMRWDYSSPAGKLFLLDGKYAWFYANGDPHVQRMKVKDLDDLRSPLRFLLGHTQLEKEFNQLTLKPAANGEFSLTGVPKGQENRIAHVTLTVRPDGAITGIETEENDGVTTRFSFTSEVANAPVPSGVFKFVPPPGVPVVDGLPPV
jgi:outer membrane lipoprotein carrier protein